MPFQLFTDSFTSKKVYCVQAGHDGLWFKDHMAVRFEKGDWIVRKTPVHEDDDLVFDTKTFQARFKLWGEPEKVDWASLGWKI